MLRLTCLSSNTATLTRRTSWWIPASHAWLHTSVGKILNLRQMHKIGPVRFIGHALKGKAFIGFRIKPSHWCPFLGQRVPEEHVKPALEHIVQEVVGFIPSFFCVGWTFYVSSYGLCITTNHASPLHRWRSSILGCQQAMPEAQHMEDLTENAGQPDVHVQAHDGPTGEVVEGNAASSVIAEPKAMVKQEHSNRRFKRAFKGCSQEVIDISGPPSKRTTAQSSSEVATSHNSLPFMFHPSRIGSLNWSDHWKRFLSKLPRSHNSREICRVKMMLTWWPETSDLTDG